MRSRRSTAAAGVPPSRRSATANDAPSAWAPHPRRATRAAALTGLALATAAIAACALPVRAPGLPALPRTSPVAAPTPEPAPPPTLAAVQAAYDAGDYARAEAAAVTLTQSPAGKPLWLAAFAAARQGKYALAKERFERLEAGGSAEPAPSVPGVTLQAEGGFQAAVLTARLQGPAAGEAAYLAFIRRYPESPLVHSAVKRIARFHNGDIPPEAERTWKTAVNLAREREQARAVASADCGPEVLAEALRRLSRSDVRCGDGCAGHDAVALAREVNQDERGTNLLALHDAARRHGLQARGLRLSWQALQGRTGPLIAHLQPGHFVLVESADPREVRVWDPDGGSLRWTAAEWKRRFTGAALVFQMREER